MSVNFSRDRLGARVSQVVLEVILNKLMHNSSLKINSRYADRYVRLFSLAQSGEGLSRSTLQTLGDL
jgi:hypothetical protein